MSANSSIGGFFVVKYREILRLQAQGLSQRSIAASCSNSRNTVKNVLEQAERHGLSWPLEPDMSDGEIQELLFPEKNKGGNIQRIPDCEYIHKELAKSSVTLSLLWDEYSLNCRENNEIPYSYRQFCRFYHAYATKTKATFCCFFQLGVEAKLNPLATKLREWFNARKPFILWQ